MAEHNPELTGSTISAHQYWLQTLAGCSIEYDLFTDFARSGAYEPQTYQLTIDDSLRRRILSMAKDNPVAVFVVLVSCFKIMLYKLSGSHDLTIVTPAYQGGKATDGFVLLRDILHADMTGKDLINAVKQTVAQGYQHQSYLTAKTARPVKSLHKPDSYQVMMAMQAVHQYRSSDEFSAIRNDVKLFVDTGNAALTCEIIFNARVYTRSSIMALMGCFSDVLQQTLQNLQLPLTEIPLLREAGLKTITEQFNDTAQPLVPTMTLDRLVEQQADRAPDAIALSTLDATGLAATTLSYRQLSRKSNHVADLLRAAGVAEGEIVAIVGERTLETVICMLAVLKAGAAFLVIAPGLPEERRAYLLADSQVRLALLTDVQQTAVPVANVLRVLDAAALPEAPVRQPAHGPAALAYAIYTSGSTGKPKGVLIEHRSIVNTISWRRSWYAFSADDVVLQIPAFSFDSSIEDVFTALASGARLVLLPDQQRLDLAYLKQVFAHNAITHFLITPGYYRLLLTNLPDALHSLRVVTVAGEHFSPDLVAQHLARLPHVELHNEYGPTENSVCSTVYRFDAANMDVRIGKPIANVRCYIVNSEGHALPIGIPGELCVAGTGLARGYLNQPELTARVFKPSPYLPEARMYWTGDRARWLADGNIVFLGRRDDQVKLRGFRIELAEIEIAMHSVAGVTGAAVVVTQTDEPLIYGFFTAREAIAPDTIKQQLARQLPYYMVPAQIFHVDHIPLTIHGKVDRQALRELALDAPIVGAENALEERLVELWAECLKIDPERISVVADFFDLGGHSLNAVVLVERIQQEFQCELPLTDLLQQSTIRSVAQYLAALPEPPDLLLKGTLPHGD